MKAVLVALVLTFAISAVRPVGADAPIDVNGDGWTDFVVVRNTGGGSSGQLTWFTKFGGGHPTGTFDWGLASDTILSADFDGDLKDDAGVWRSANATFYIIQSATFTFRLDQLGQAGDDPTVIEDYDGDGNADVAVYRPGSQGTWYYRTASNLYFKTVNWGATNDRVAPGDYDGDGIADFVVYRPDNGTWYKRLTSDGFGTEFFSFPGSFYKVVPGDYDGDGKTDLSIRGMTLIGDVQWHYEPSSIPGATRISVLIGNFEDIPVQGDYTGDGRTDFAVWQPSTGRFLINVSGNGNVFADEWGEPGDIPVAVYNAH